MRNFTLLLLILVSISAQAAIGTRHQPTEMELAETRAKVLMQMASSDSKQGFTRKLIYCVGPAMGNVILKNAGGHCWVEGKHHYVSMDGMGSTGGLALRGTVLVAEIAPGSSLNGVYTGVEFGLAFTILGAHVGFFQREAPADGSKIYLIGYQAGLMGDLTRTSLKITDVQD